MQIVTSIAEMQSISRKLRAAGSPLGFVPTMGALHEGHLSLVHRASVDCVTVVASIFVNPLQFAPGEDLAKYPRTFDQDCSLLEAAGVAAVFAPTAPEMYPAGAITTVTVAGLADRLDGASRPGHFTGVATVVAKLFHIVTPDRAYFGQKDAAQLAVLRKMVKDLNFNLEIVGCPIVRNANGLALSSRNKYLTAEEEVHALILNQTLRQIERSIANGDRDALTLTQNAANTFHSAPGVRLDYLAIVDAATLLPLSSAQPGSLVAIAANVGSTRLIDNFIVD